MKKESLFLSRESLLEKDELRKEKVELSKGHVYVREMTGAEKDTWEKSMLKEKPSGDKHRAVEYEVNIEGFRAKLAVVTVCDAEGNLIFKPEDAKVLNKVISASNLDRIIVVAQRLNAITEEDKEEILKNSKADQEKSSNSGSAEI
jgi:ribosomal protein L2